MNRFRPGYHSFRGERQDGDPKENPLQNTKKKSVDKQENHDSLVFSDMETGFYKNQHFTVPEGANSKTYGGFP